MGEVFAGRFELLDPIAEGGMGSVWLVRDLKDRQLYAGKLLRQSDSASLLRFMREQSTRIRHPHVVTPLSWAGEDARVLFTMPLVRGGSVATLIRDRRRLPAAWVVIALRQTLDALAAVHAEGIVHRDIKPGNLLLHPTGNAPPYLLLTDFGISARIDEPRLTHASQVIGSPGYMAPEQLSGADPHPAQDLYAVGMVGLEMLTGTRPPEAVAEARDLRDREPGLASLLDLLLAAASPAVADRPASALDFRDRLAVLPTERGTGPGIVVRDHLQPPPGPPATSPDRSAPATVAADATQRATRRETQPQHSRANHVSGAGRARGYAALLIVVGLLSLVGAVAMLVVG